MTLNRNYLTVMIGKDIVRAMKICLFLTVALLPLNFAFARATGDGGGINGPETRGQAIPVVMDGVVEVDELIEANQICIQTGDKARGVESLAQKLAFLIFGQNDFVFEKIKFRPGVGDAYEYDIHTKLGYSANIKGGMNHDSYLPDDNHFSFYASLSLYRNWDDLTKNPFPTLGRLTVRKTTIAGGEKKASGAELSLDNVLPFFRWDRIDTLCEGYDDFGSCIHPRRVPVGLKIQTSINHGTAVPLINEDTKQPSSIVINTEELAQCMASEVRRIAK
jgi:hypothetical protein